MNSDVGYSQHTTDLKIWLCVLQIALGEYETWGNSDNDCWINSLYTDTENTVKCGRASSQQMHEWDRAVVLHQIFSAIT